MPANVKFSGAHVGILPGTSPASRRPRVSFPSPIATRRRGRAERLQRINNNLDPLAEADVVIHGEREAVLFQSVQVSADCVSYHLAGFSIVWPSVTKPETRRGPGPISIAVRTLGVQQQQEVSLSTPTKAVISAATKEQQNHDDDQKGGHIHIILQQKFLSCTIYRLCQLRKQARNIPTCTPISRVTSGGTNVPSSLTLRPWR